MFCTRPSFFYCGLNISCLLLSSIKHSQFFKLCICLFSLNWRSCIIQSQSHVSSIIIHEPDSDVSYLLVDSWFYFGSLNGHITECHCCYWLGSFRICGLGISLLHGVIKKARYRSNKATITTGNFSRALYKHWFTWRWTWSSDLFKEVIYRVWYLILWVGKQQPAFCLNWIWFEFPPQDGWTCLH